MAKPVWQQKLQARLDACPLFWEKPTAEAIAANRFAASRIVCAECGAKGKKGSLRELVNYSFHTCDKCGFTVR